MDLRTIKSKLGDDEHELQYTAPHEVADDIRLIAENCNKFNTGPQNEGVRKLAENLLQMFEKKWREHAFEGCLLYTSPSPRDLSTSRMPSSA